MGAGCNFSIRQKFTFVPCTTGFRLTREKFKKKSVPLLFLVVCCFQVPYRCVVSAELENDLISIPVLTLSHSICKVQCRCKKFQFDLYVKCLLMSPWLGRLGDYSPHYDVKFDLPFYHLPCVTAPLSSMQTLKFKTEPMVSLDSSVNHKLRKQRLQFKGFKMSRVFCNWGV